MTPFGTMCWLVSVLSFFLPINAATNTTVNEVRALLKDSVDYQNWCSECRGNGTDIDLNLYIKLCHKFDAEMMEILDSLHVMHTSTQYFSIFMDKEFCLNATVSALSTTNSSHPKNYVTVWNEIPGWNETQLHKRKVKTNDQGLCPLYWIIPVSVVAILIAILGVISILYRANRQIQVDQKQVEDGPVFDSIDNL